MVVRENVEGEYSEIGGRINRGFADEMAVQESVFTRVGVSRIADYAFELARHRGGYLTSATKSNGIVHTMPFWDEVVAERAAAYPDVRWDSELIDALAAKVVLEPERFDVIVASNLFGDILSDLTAAVAGSIGIAPSANLDPTREHPSMFEPVHGSAPDIAGKGVANPIGTLWSAAMMLDHLGHEEAATELMEGIRESLRDSRDPDPRPRRLRRHHRGDQRVGRSPAALTLSVVEARGAAPATSLETQPLKDGCDCGLNSFIFLAPLTRLSSSFEHVQALLDVVGEDVAVVPVRRPRTTQDQPVGRRARRGRTRRSPSASRSC